MAKKDRRESDREQTQRMPHLADSVRALERAEKATQNERDSVRYNPKNYPTDLE